MRRGSAIGLLSLRPSWCVSRLILSWLAGGGTWVRAAKNATKTIPVVRLCRNWWNVQGKPVQSIAERAIGLRVIV